MGRLFMDGYEYGSDSLAQALLYSYWNTPYAGIGTSPFSGTYALLISAAGSGAVRRTLVVAKNQLYVKVHYQPNNVTPGSVGTIFSLFNGSNIIGWLQANGRDLKLWLGSGTGTQLGSTAANVLGPLGTDWNLIELRWKVDDSPNGIAQVKVSESLVIDANGVDTKPGADTTISIVGLDYNGVDDSRVSGRYDDFIIDDTDWVGNRRVCKIQPTGADASYDDWTPSTGSNWDCVDEIPYSDTDYVSTNSADQVDLHTCSDLPVSAISAKGIMLIGRAVKEGIPTPQNIQLAIRTNSNNYFGDSYVPSAGSPGFFYKHWTQNPNTSADFSVSEMNAIEIGYKSVT